jgi:hypothetical protein
MIICFEVVFNRALSNSKTHLIVKLKTFPHSRRARAGFGWGRGAVPPPPNSNYYRKFVRNYSTIATPLTNLKKSKIPFEWNHEQETAFTQLKETIVNTFILRADNSFSMKFKWMLLRLVLLRRCSKRTIMVRVL